MFRSLSVGLTLIASSLGAQSLEFISATPVTGGLEGLGGLSAIEMETGERALTVSDRGRFFDLVFTRDAAGNLTKAHALAADIPRTERDTEGLAIGTHGTFVSHEGKAVVRQLFGRKLPRHPAFARLPRNRALEALAMDAQGRLYTLPEHRGAHGAPFPVYIFDNGRWHKGPSIPKRNGFVPVGADFGPDGLFYLLERRFSAFGFRSQIRRFDLGSKGLDEDVLLTTDLLEHDNLEGLSVWTDASGTVRLTMVSDDNFQSFLRNEVVEYRLIE